MSACADVYYQALLDSLLLLDVLSGCSCSLLKVVVEYALSAFPGSTLLSEELQSALHDLHGRPNARFRLVYSNARDGRYHHELDAMRWPPSAHIDGGSQRRWQNRLCLARSPVDAGIRDLHSVHRRHKGASYAEHESEPRAE